MLSRVAKVVVILLFAVSIPFVPLTTIESTANGAVVEVVEVMLCSQSCSIDCTNATTVAPAAGTSCGTFTCDTNTYWVLWPFLGIPCHGCTGCLDGDFNDFDATQMCVCY